MINMYNLLHRSLEEELRECKIDLEAKEKEIESLMERWVSLNHYLLECPKRRTYFIF